MKKLFALLLLIVVTATSAMAALEFSITPGEQDIAVGGSLTATLTATNNGAPVSNLPVQIKPGYSSDLLITIDPTTNALGQATISIQHVGSTNGDYFYTVTDGVTTRGARVSAEVSAIPEFTTIGAALALAGAAGIYLIRKRK